MDNKNISKYAFLIGLLLIVGVLVYLLWISLDPLFALFILGVILVIIGGTYSE